MEEDFSNVVKIQIVEGYEKVVVTPHAGYDFDAGYDLFAAEDVVLQPGETKKIATGWRICIPLDIKPRYYGQVADRSSVAHIKQLHVVGGVIDPPYHGHVHVILHNFGKEAQQITVKQKIAQLIFLVYANPILVKVETDEQFAPTDRGQKGFGSTDQKLE